MMGREPEWANPHSNFCNIKYPNIMFTKGFKNINSS